MGKTYKIGDFITVEELDDKNVSLKESDKDIIIDSSKYKGKELRYYQSNLQGKTIHHPVLGDIHLGRKGKRETAYRSNPKYLAVLCFIDKIIETGYSNGQQEKLDHPRTKGSIFTFYSIYNEVIFDGTLLGITVVIAEDFEGKKYYMFRSYTQNESLMWKSAGVPQNEELYKLHPASIIIIKHDHKNVNPLITKCKNINSINEQHMQEKRKEMKNIFKKLNEQLKPLLEEIITGFGGDQLDYNNPDKIYRSIQYNEKENSVEVDIWLYEQKQKYDFRLYSPKLKYLWEKRIKTVFKEYNPKVYTFEASGNENQLKIEFTIPEINEEIDVKIYSLLEEALSDDKEIIEKSQEENTYPEGKRIQYEDDLVVVYDPSGEEIYKGMEDYEPMKDENWKWDMFHGYYTLNGYVKVCLGE